MPSWAALECPDDGLYYGHPPLNIGRIIADMPWSQGKLAKVLCVVLSVAVLAACDGPEQREASHLDRGKEFFQLTLGGSSDENASLGDRLGPGLPQEDVPNAIEAIVDQYLRVRQHDERFLDTYRRVGIVPFKDAVYGSADSKGVA